MAFQTMKNLLPQRLRQNGLAQPVRVAQAIETANQVLDEWFGAQTTELRAKAVSIKFKQLSIASLDAALRQELKLRERELVSAINSKIGDMAVERLRLLI